MRTQEQFPNFGEVDDLTNFEEIQRGLAGEEDEWVYMHRGLGVSGRYKVEGTDHGARDRRGLHARIHPRVEAPDEGVAEPRRAAGAVNTPTSIGRFMLRRRVAPSRSIEAAPSFETRTSCAPQDEGGTESTV